MSPSILEYFKSSFEKTTNTLIMDLENNQWDLADKNLNVWLNEDKNESSFPLSDILKSTYLSFRQKQIDRFSNFCKQAFVYYQEQEEIRKQRLLLVQESQFEDNNVMFSKVRLSESERRDRILKENQKIFSGILSGNQMVFNDLYEYEFPKAVKLVIQNSGTIDMAKDIFQDALVILIEKVYTKKLDLTCSASTYLYSICRFLWMDQLRQNKREIPITDEYSYKNIDITVSGFENTPDTVSYTHLRAHETRHDIVCRLLLEKKKQYHP